MVKVDLITGFLGSGKTTFIRDYAQYLIAQGKNIAILENDFGAINVDRMLLEDLDGDHCDVEMVVGGSDYDCHKRRFKSKLITLGMLGYDRIIVEPSGIYDVDEFFDALNEDPLDKWYAPGSVISIVDAHLEDNLSEESQYLLVSQIANAGKIVISRSQEVDSERITHVLDQIDAALAKFQCTRRIDRAKEVLYKDRGTLTAGDFESLLAAGHRLEAYVKRDVAERNDYDHLFYMNVKLDEDRIPQTIGRLFSDPKCGGVIRVKGFFHTPDGRWIEVNATRTNLSVSAQPRGQEVVIVIGENLNRDAINACWDYRYAADRTTDIR